MKQEIRNENKNKMGVQEVDGEHEVDGEGRNTRIPREEAGNTTPSLLSGCTFLYKLKPSPTNVLNFVFVSALSLAQLSASLVLNLWCLSDQACRHLPG